MRDVQDIQLQRKGPVEWDGPITKHEPRLSYVSLLKNDILLMRQNNEESLLQAKHDIFATISPNIPRMLYAI